MEIIFATKNQGKVRELQALIEQNNLENLKLLSLLDFETNLEIKETGKTFLENAVIKAKTIFEKFKKPVIADDSGLIVEELNEPGIFSARYAGENATDEDNNLKLIKNVKNLKNREAYFECALVFINEKGKIYSANEKCFGEIILKPKGNKGFGYDPIFYLPEYKKTMAEIPIEEKNQISHRGKAFKKIVEILRGLYG